MSRWDLYTRMIVDLDPILADMTAHGVRLDAERQRTLIHQLEDRIDTLTAQATELAPLEVRPRKRYKRKPTDTDMAPHELLQEVRVPGKVKACSLCGEKGITKTRHMKRECRKAEVVLVDDLVLEWDRLLAFNPLSTEQMKAYALHYRHPLGFDPKTTRPTLDDHQLEKLQHKYGERFPMYGLVRDLREVSKMRSTYAWTPDARGYVTGQYLHAPKTGRLAQRNYNLMNVPHREGNPWAAPIRRTLRPSPGCVFVEADSSAIEAVLTGYFAGDDTLIDLSKRSVHAYLCCQRLGLEFTPANVKEVKTHHEGLYAAMKQTVYLCMPPDHEVLTPLGWRRMDQVRQDEPIAIWDRETQVITFETPERWNRYDDYEGELVQWEGTALDALMTPNHRVPYRADARGGWRMGQAADIPVSASIPLVGAYKGGQPGTAVVPALLAASIQADATFTGTQVKWCLVKPRKIARLRELLTQLGIPWREHWPEAYPGRCHVTVDRAEVREALEYLTEEKTWDLPALLTLPWLGRVLLLEEVLHWDGCATTNSYASMQRENVDAIQTIAHLTGIRALIHQQSSGLWTLSFSTKAKCGAIDSLRTNTRVAYRGTVMCPTVSTGCFLVRHGGKISVTGNSLYGGTPKMMRFQAPQHFPTLQAATELQDFFLSQFPSLRRWWEHTREFAHKHNGLTNPWGWKNYFYNVYRRNELGEIILGEDKNEVAAFLPQSAAAMFMRDNLRLIGATWARPYMPAIGTVHDSICLDVPEALVQDAIGLLTETLTRPIPELGGLRIGCEVKVGEDWWEMPVVHADKALDRLAA